MPKGYLAFILHAHLPYVRHPEDQHALEERWFFEAVTETYIPLLTMLENLARDRVPCRLTISLSPTLSAMFGDSLLQERYLSHLEKLIELAEREMERTAHQQAFRPLAEMYHGLFLQARHIFHDLCQDNLIHGFRHFQDAGLLELMTCCATHGYLPLLGVDRAVVRAQVEQAVQEHTLNYGRRPEGIWLPECGFNPEDDRMLAGAGIRYFVLDTHGLLYATPRPRYGVYAPVRTPAGVHAFGRDLESSLQVWSAQEGYPGDFDYREFYRDVGYDLDYEYIKDYLHPSGLRLDTGLKYYRISGKTEDKEPYIPEWGRDKAAIHAGNFLFNREKQIAYLAGQMDRRPVVVCPYDAELFGHWWFEGPLFLEYFLRKAAYDQQVFRTATLSEYLNEYPVNQPATPCMSSWGNNGYNDVWLEGSNDWIYRHLHQAAKKMQRLAARGEKSPLEDQALRQAARELFLAQSSDWAFIMKTGTMVDYAHRRTVNHLGRFLKLNDDLNAGELDPEWLDLIAGRDNLFPRVDSYLMQ